MKRKRLLVFPAIFIAAAAAVFSLFYNEPPIREEIEDDPQNYLKTNRFVREERKVFAEEGRITPDFLPPQIDAERTVEYLYWYACAILGSPNYAISVTIQFPAVEILQRERNRIKSLENFEEIIFDDCIIIGGERLSEQLEGFFEPPVKDGTRYILEYAIISMEARTITYSEVCIWENQIRHETIDSQLEFVYAGTKSTGN